MEATPATGDWVPPAWLADDDGDRSRHLVAIGLNALLRFGMPPQRDADGAGRRHRASEVDDFASRAGVAWGARPEVVARASELVSWCLDAIVQAGLARGDITVTLAFDEFRLDVRISYEGKAIELAAAPPSPEELIDDDAAAARLAGYMIRRRASRARVRERDGVTQLDIIIDH